MLCQQLGKEGLRRGRGRGAEWREIGSGGTRWGKIYGGNPLGQTLGKTTDGK